MKIHVRASKLVYDSMHVTFEKLLTKDNYPFDTKTFSQYLKIGL